MNGTFYKNPTFPGNDDDAIMNNYTDNIEEAVILGDKTNLEPGIDYLPMEQSYIENILRLNKGRRAIAYASFPDSTIWRDKKYDGIIEQAGRDHLVMSDDDGKWYLIPMIYLNYVEFDEKIIYRPVELQKKERN